MFPRRFKDPKTGFHMLSSMQAKKYLNKFGLEREDYYFLKQVGKALLCTYTILGAVWLYNDASPMEWWKLMPRPKEEFELADLFRNRECSCSTDEEATKELIAKGGMMGTTSGSKGMVESDNKDAINNQKELQDKKFGQEAQKMWLKMRNEVIAELQEKGIDME